MRKALYFKHLFTLLVIFSLISCGSADTSLSPPDFNTNQATNTIQLGVINANFNNRSQIEVPLSIFGSSIDDLEGAAIVIQRDGFQDQSLTSLQDFYVTSVQLVAFFLFELTDGEDITFVITKNTGARVTYAGVLSNSEVTQATLQATTTTTPNPSSTLEEELDDLPEVEIVEEKDL